MRKVYNIDKISSRLLNSLKVTKCFIELTLDKAFFEIFTR